MVINSKNFNENLPMAINFYYFFFIILAFPLNFLLIFLIWVKSPSSFSTYRLLLLNTSINQTFLITMAFLLQMRVISSGESVALLPYGPFRYAPLEVSFVAHNVYNVFLCATNLSILLSMHFRYSLICLGKCENFTVTRNFSLIWIISLGMLIGILIPSFDFSTVMINTEVSYPSYHLLDSYGHFGGFKSTKSPIYFLNTTILLGIPYPMPIFVLIWRYRIFKQINEVQVHLSERTKKASLDLVRALTMQAIFPMICLIPNVVYFALTQHIHIEAEIAEYMSYPTCVLPCLTDPILTIYYVAPYRNFVTRKKKSASTPSAMVY